MPVSVIMPVLNSASVIDDQLDALTRQDFAGDWELVVADNGCTDTTIEHVSRFADRLPLRVVDASARRGDMAARNIAVSQTRSDLVVFCDADDVVSAQWLSGHVEELAISHLSVGPHVMRTDMADANAGTYVSAPLRGVYGFLPYGLSANMGVRRSTFDALAGFDEAFRVGYDVEFCWRTQVGGFRIGAADDAVVVKRKRGDTRGVWRQHRAFGVADVRLYSTYRSHGMPRALSKALRTYGWLGIHITDLFSNGGRSPWIAVAAQRYGRFVGSIRGRVLYL